MRKNLRHLFIVFCVLLGFTSLKAQNYYIEITDAPNADVIGTQIKVLGTGAWYTQCLPLNVEQSTQLVNPWLASPAPLDSLNGNVGVAKRGTYAFIEKVKNIQNAGGTGMILINSTAAPGGMSGADTSVTIWGVMIGAEYESLFTDNPGLKFKFIDLSSTSNSIVFWGNEPGQGDFDGGLHGWTSVTNCNDESGVSNWKVTPYGANNGAYGGGTIQSPTACNGAAYFQSDSLDNGGVQGNFGNGPCAAPQYASLVSPTIDLSTLPAGTKVSLEFYQTLRQYQSKYYVAWSSDNGATWDSVQINSEIDVNASMASQVRRVPLKGLELTDQVKVRFTMDANYYWWAVDDVTIVKIEDYNIQLPLASNWFAGPTLATNPVSQKFTNVWMTDITNVGGKTATNVKLNVTVNDSTGAEVFNHTLDIGDINSGDTLQNIVNPEMTMKTPDQPGIYTINYSITMDSTDYNTDDNTKSIPWVVSDTTWSPAITYDNSWVFGSSLDWFCGAIFAYETATANNRFDHAVVSYTFNSADADVIGRSLEVRVYEYSDDDGDKQISQAELTGGFQIAGADITIHDINTSVDTVRLFNLDFEPTTVEMKPGKSYIVGIKYKNDIDDKLVYFPSDGRINTVAAEYAQLTLDPALHRPNNLWHTSTNDFNINTDRSSANGPYMFIYTPDRLALSNKKNILPAHSISVFPTVAKDFVNVEFDLNKSTAGTIEVIDFNGKVIYSAKSDNYSTQLQRIELGNVPSGNYLVKFTTNEGVVAKQFNVSK
jgi:hypothetical protein